MSIFEEIKERLTAVDVARHYGLAVRRNGMANCPFHDDKHPSMKIDKIYFCFGCGEKGDCINYVAKMFGLSQYEAAIKIIEDFGLPINIGNGIKKTYSIKGIREKEKKKRERSLKDRFKGWKHTTLDNLKNAESEIYKLREFLELKLKDKVMDSDDFAELICMGSVINYWLDILCFGEEEDILSLFIEGRGEVLESVRRTEELKGKLMGSCRRNTG